MARKALAVMAVAALAAVMAPIAFGAMAPGASKSKPAVVFNGLDANPVLGKTFMARIGEGPKGTDNCSILEQHEPRDFYVSPFGPPASGKLRIFFTDGRKPKVSVLRWSSDPNTTGAKPESLKVSKLLSARFESKTTSWSAQVRVPASESSYLVVKVAWPDSKDCAAGPDKLAAGAAFIPEK